MQQNDNANSKRIAKNTLLLYVRMLFLMLVSLYTSRVILNTLGVEDYGIYNVVGGLVMMFTMLSGSLNSAISRFLVFELGTGNKRKLKMVFSTSVTIQIVLALIIILIAESVGLWFLYYKMVIPSGRMMAANWCFQFSLITFVVNLISVPYNSAIIAHEKMDVFAYISIIDCIGRLIIAWCIVLSPIDNLIFYAFMLSILACLIRFLYGWYCKKHYEECNFHFVYNYTLLKQMFGFAGWNFFGAGSYQLMTQGVNLLSNVFFGVTVNAARGIATQVEHAVTMFTNSFTTAINPQITKSYASNQKDYMFMLVSQGAKYSYFLLLYVAIPLLCETQIILNLWLKNVPDYAIWFVRLTVVICLISVLSNTMITAVLATGNIKKYQIIVGGIGMFTFPLVWIFFSLGLRPEMAYFSTIIIVVIQFVCRLFLLRGMMSMPIIQFLKQVIIKVILVSLFSFIIPLFICVYFKGTIFRCIIVFISSTIIITITVLYVGLSVSERVFILTRIKNKLIEYPNKKEL